jgi:type III secretory pathway component EscT
MTGIVAAVLEVLHRDGIDLERLGLGWARVAPAVVLVPAFGLRALPRTAQALMSLALAASLWPALAPASRASSAPWAFMALSEIVRGLPVAVGAAVPLWAATMAGGVADAVRGTQDLSPFPTVEGRATPLGVPLSLIACAIFVTTGGPARVAEALAFAPMNDHPAQTVAAALVSGITLAVALAGPLLGGAVVVEVAAALVARAASPAQIHALLAPLRALATLGILAIAFHGLVEAIARSQSGMW